MDKVTHRQANSQGAAAVEMAFTTMLLVLLVCGIVDLGRVIYTDIGVKDAAQEGARFAAYDASSESAIIGRVLTATDYPSAETLSVSAACTDSSAGTVVVTVSTEVQYMTPIIRNLLGGSVTIERTSWTDVLNTEGCQL